MNDNAIFQPPLARRGIGPGPGVIVFLPASADLNQRIDDNSLDPEPIQKWAEEGFAVVGLTSSLSGWSLVEDALKKSVSVLLTAKEVGVP